MSGNITKQDAKAGLKRCYRFIRWPDSQGAESRWKMNHGNGRLGLPGFVPSVCLPPDKPAQPPLPASPAPLSTGMPTRNPDTV